MNSRWLRIKGGKFSRLSTIMSWNSRERLVTNQSLNSESDGLLAATEALAIQVEALSVALQTNSMMIAGLRKEVDQKPDDEEVKWIAGDTKRQRHTLLKASIGTAIGAGLVAGAIAISVASDISEDRCQKNAQNIEAIAAYIEEYVIEPPQAQELAKELRQNRNNC